MKIYLPLGTHQWRIVQTQGAKPRGTFGHTSVYDRRKRYIYVYGGLTAKSSTITQATLTDQLLRYDPGESRWLVLPSSSLFSTCCSCFISVSQR